MRCLLSIAGRFVDATAYHLYAGRQTDVYALMFFASYICCMQFSIGCVTAATTNSPSKRASDRLVH